VSKETLKIGYAQRSMTDDNNKCSFDIESGRIQTIDYCERSLKYPAKLMHYWGVDCEKLAAREGDDDHEAVLHVTACANIILLDRAVISSYHVWVLIAPCTVPRTSRRSIFRLRPFAGLWFAVDVFTGMRGKLAAPPWPYVDAKLMRYSFRNVDGRKSFPK
jgi:hypothetical protein